LSTISQLAPLRILQGCESPAEPPVLSPALPLPASDLSVIQSSKLPKFGRQRAISASVR
jgi:hypothetical protein